MRVCCASIVAGLQGNCIDNRLGFYSKVSGLGSRVSAYKGVWGGFRILVHNV